MALSFGLRLFAARPVTRPEVHIDGWPMSSINRTWGELKTSTREVGDWQASWTMARQPRSGFPRHPALRIGAPVEVHEGPIVAWVGSLTEPNWDSGELVALGAPREGETALALDALGQLTTKPNTAIDQAIARGVVSWTRGADFGDTEIGAGDAGTRPNSLALLLDAWAEEQDPQPAGWRVDRQRRVHTTTDAETAPAWFITPGVGEMGAADDERVDRMFVRYTDSATSDLATASYPATTPAGGIERGVNITGRGPITAAKATNIAKGIWSRLQGRSGWTNGLTVSRNQITRPGGAAADLALIKAGDAMRLLGVPDPRGLGQHIDVVIGETDYDWAAGTIQLNPVGLADRTLEAVLEDDGHGDVAL